MTLSIPAIFQKVKPNKDQNYAEINPAAASHHDRPRADGTPADLENWGWLRLAFPVLITGLLTAFWFGSVAAHQREDIISRLKQVHAKERETMRISAERAKTKLIKQSHHKIMQ